MNAQMTELTSKVRTKPTHTAGSFHEKRVGGAPPLHAPHPAWWASHTQGVRLPWERSAGGAALA